MKKLLSVLLILLLSACTVAGCTSYVGLDNMTIVAGVGVDLSEDGGFATTFEVVDIFNSSKDTGLKSIIVESQGKTIFDAIRNARKQLPNKLYFGNNNLIVISKEFAEQKGLIAVVDFFVRDEECRETVSIVITDHEKAVDVLKAKGLLSNVTSYGLKNIIEACVKHAGTIHSIELYQAYNRMLDDRRQVSLPLITISDTSEEEHVEISGMAIFKKEKMIDKLDAEESKHYLYITNEKEGGIITIENLHDTNYSLEIFKNKTKVSYKENNGSFIFTLDITTDIYIAEDSYKLQPFDQQVIDEILQTAQNELEENVKAIIHKVQSQSASDIFGFSSIIHQRDAQLWHSIREDWDNIFPTIEVEVKCKINALNTANLK